jgi:hypothetical protein
MTYNDPTCLECGASVGKHYDSIRDSWNGDTPGEDDLYDDAVTDDQGNLFCSEICLQDWFWKSMNEENLNENVEEEK